MKNLKVYMLAVALLFLCLPVHALATDIQHFQVNTSVGFGTVWINGVPDHDPLAVGTLLSGELAQIIESDPVFGDPRLSQLEEMFGTLSNLEFLTGTLIQFGNAGDQIEDEFTALFDALNSSTGGTGTASISNTYLGSDSYDLFGGVVNETTVIIGSANVDFYEVIAYLTVPTDSMQPIPEPGTLLLVGTGLAGILVLRKKTA